MATTVKSWLEVSKQIINPAEAEIILAVSMDIQDRSFFVTHGADKISDEARKKAEEEAKNSESSRTATTVTYTYTGSILTKSKGTNNGPSGKETYYNLNMSRVVAAMSRYGYSSSDYWVRADGVKMLGNYVMVAASYTKHPKGSLVSTSLGTGIVCDTGGFAASNPTQIDIATNW